MSVGPDNFKLLLLTIVGTITITSAIIKIIQSYLDRRREDEVKGHLDRVAADVKQHVSKEVEEVKALIASVAVDVNKRWDRQDERWNQLTDMLKEVHEVSKLTHKLHCMNHKDGVTPRCFPPADIDDLLKEIGRKFDSTSGMLSSLLKSQERETENQESIVRALLKLEQVLARLQEEFKL